jgi:type I restriction enzyme, S subunit
LFYYCQSSFVKVWLESQASATTVTIINKGKFQQLPVPLPSLTEQQQIIEVIETQFTRLDAAVTALKRVKANLRRYRAAVLKAACEGRLVPTEADLARTEGRIYEPAAALLERILAERRAKWQAEHPGKKYKEPAGPDVSRLSELPEGWCWATVEQLSSHRRYSLAIGPFGSSLKVSDYRESGVPLVFVRNIRAAKFTGLDDHFVSQEKANELKAHTVSGGDILITKMGEPPGDACMYPLAATPGAVITADCIKLALCDECVEHTQLFVHFLNAAPVRDQVNHITQGVAQKKVSLERYRTIALPLPPLLEQDRIVNAIETLLSASGVLVDDVAANLKRAERLRQAILVSAFSGRLASAQDDAMKQVDFSF